MVLQQQQLLLTQHNKSETELFLPPTKHLIPLMSGRVMSTVTVISDTKPDLFYDQYKVVLELLVLHP